MLLGKPWHLLAESPGTASTVLLRPLCWLWGWASQPCSVSERAVTELHYDGPEG